MALVAEPVAGILWVIGAWVRRVIIILPVVLAVIQPVVEALVIQFIVQPLVLRPRHRITMSVLVLQIPMKLPMFQLVVIAAVIGILRLGGGSEYRQPA